MVSEACKLIGRNKLQITRRGTTAEVRTPQGEQPNLIYTPLSRRAVQRREDSMLFLVLGANSKRLVCLRRGGADGRVTARVLTSPPTITCLNNNRGGRKKRTYFKLSVMKFERLYRVRRTSSRPAAGLTARLVFPQQYRLT